MNDRLLSKPLWSAIIIRDIIFAIIAMAPDEHPVEHLAGVIGRIYGMTSTPIAYLLQGLGYLTIEMQPTGDWSRLMAAEPRVRRELLRTAFEDAFRAPDGSSATEAIKTSVDRSARIDWFVQKHELSRSTTAAYAERLYRRAFEALDAASRRAAYEASLSSETEPQPVDLPQTTASAQAIRAVPRSHEHRSRGIELVFWLPDGAGSSAYERIFQAADETIFSKEGNWEPLRDVDPKKVRLDVVESDQNLPPRGLGPRSSSPRPLSE